MILDWLAAGLDPAKSILFVQSEVSEVTELHTLLSMTTPLGWLMRVPTFKEKVKMQPTTVNYACRLPGLMTSDMFSSRRVSSGGEDQLPHWKLRGRSCGGSTPLMRHVPGAEPKAHPGPHDRGAGRVPRR